MKIDTQKISETLFKTFTNPVFITALLGMNVVSIFYGLAMVLHSLIYIPFLGINFISAFLYATSRFQISKTSPSIHKAVN
ncbi:hypothetical protein [Methanosarcina acetivorans]|uniref:hypothetical protein n=1 Tax=Methanosarcina acetivorans TaxID=2214 RepID=UPI00064F6723|nr:hypothetical protein [Methanosarcina acetivorans]